MATNAPAPEDVEPLIEHLKDLRFYAARLIDETNDDNTTDATVRNYRLRMLNQIMSVLSTVLVFKMATTQQMRWFLSWASSRLADLGIVDTSNVTIAGPGGSSGSKSI